MSTPQKAEASSAETGSLDYKAKLDAAASQTESPQPNQNEAGTIVDKGKPMQIYMPLLSTTRLWLTGAQCLSTSPQSQKPWEETETRTHPRVTRPNSQVRPSDQITTHKSRSL